VISYIGIGSNLGDRNSIITSALKEVAKIKDLKILKKSYIYENPASINCETRNEWSKSFLNMAIKISSQGLTPEELLNTLKEIEKKLGRLKSVKWAARTLDLDLLYIQKTSVSTDRLTVPHKELKNRNFVTAPLRDLDVNLCVNGDYTLNLNRSLQNPLPVWMGIANLTPDSFSDGGKLKGPNSFLETLEAWSKSGVHLIDIGAESTRPGAKPITPKEEQRRLLPTLQIYKSFQSSHSNTPALSLDSRNFETIKSCLKFKPKTINDVSGLSDIRILDLIKDSDCDYVLMHSLSVPADLNKTFNKILTTQDATKNIMQWLEAKLELIDKKNISLDRIIFDPGIGFGKTPLQSIELIRSIKKYQNKNLRLMCGHSRKSFMTSFSGNKPSSRDFESVGISLALAKAGVDFLRVHEPEKHIKTHLGFLYAH